MGIISASNNALQLTAKRVAPIVAMLLPSTEFSRYLMSAFSIKRTLVLNVLNVCYPA